jgi:hypothetical protein
MTRTFESGPARREATYLAFAVCGYSGSGKTKSALRLADGMRRVKPGPTFIVDTNLRRSLHHADAHQFHAVHMVEPFDPDSFMAAFKHCIDNGAARIIVDSMSDEHEGFGGVLDWHDVEIDRMAKGDESKELKVSRAAWKAPKDAHRRLRLWMWQQPVDWILCYRAKDKQDANQKPLGMQPIGGADVIFDLLFALLLPPRGDGKPVWKTYDGQSLTHAEKQLTKMPGWFEAAFAQHPQLNEDIGEQLARWAAGGDVGSFTATSSPRTLQAPAGLAARFDACTTRVARAALEAEMNAEWKRISVLDRSAITEAFKRSGARIKQAETRASNPPPIDAEEAAEIARREAADAV